MMGWGGWWGKGVGRGFNQKFFNKTGIITLSLVIGMHIMR